MMSWFGHTAGMSGFGVLFMVVVWGSLIALAVWAVARMTPVSHVTQSSAESPRQILDRRFASGEIDAEQYAAARRVLEGRSIDTTAPSG
jgi:putative membrane protein